MRIISFDIGIRNFAYTVIESTKDAPPQVRAMEVVDLGAPRNQIQRLLDRVLDLLEEIFQQHLADSPRVTVLIESQMTSVMKAIQTTINVFFKLQARYQGLDIETRYLSAHHKLSLMDRYPDFPRGSMEANSSKYKKNKSDSVRLVTWLLETQYPDAAIQEKIQKIKKADDLCDTYLMCLHHHLSRI